MEKTKTLFTADPDQEWEEKFSQYFDIEKKGYAISHSAKPVPLVDDELVSALEGKEAFIIAYDHMTKEVIEKSPDLKIILSVRDGPEENVDLETCTNLGIPVISSAGRCAVSVAEYTFMLMLELARPMVPVYSRIRNEGWTRENWKDLRSMYCFTASELFNKTLGIIGFGRNARTLAPMAKGFNMKVQAYDPYVTAEDMAKLGVEKASLEDVCKNADYLAVLARLTPETEGILTRDLIFSMKKSASIINTGRGKLVDTEAIYDALEQDVIKSAALDAHTVEPIGVPGENRMFNIPEEKLIISPHAAGVTVERTWHQYEKLFEQLEMFYRGEIPYGCVNKKVFDTPQFKERGGKFFGIKEK